MSESEGRGKGAPLASGRQSRGTGFAENLARVRRKPDRARYDTAAVHAVLDAAPFCHVATVRHGRPVVLPMVHGRVGDMLVLHGSAAAGLVRDMRRASNHSVNYRSVTVHGDATEVTDPGDVMIGMWALVEHIAPGRWEQVRKPLLAELRDTAMWQVPIEVASVKARSGSTIDPQSDLALPVWAGHIPAELVFGQPVPADNLPASVHPAGGAVELNSALGRVAWPRR